MHESSEIQISHSTSTSKESDNSSLRKEIKSSPKDNVTIKKRKLHKRKPSKFDNEDLI